MTAAMIIEIRPEFINCIKTSLNVIEIFNRVWVRGFYNLLENTSKRVITKFITVMKIANMYEKKRWIH
jgi:hypothetical protein